MEHWETDGYAAGSLNPNTVFTEEGRVLKCPKCGGNYTHLECIIPYSTDMTRPCVELVFSCETCEEKDKLFSLCVQQHEGYTYLTKEKEY